MARPTVVSVVCAVLAFAVVAVALQKLAVSLADGAHPVGHARQVNQTRTFLLQLLGGAVLSGGLIFTARTFLLSKSTQTAERFTKSIEQVGNQQSVGVRIGGIYGLGLVAEADGGYWDAVDQILTAFIRDHGIAGQNVTADVQACLNVLAMRGRRSAEMWVALDLRDTHLRKADLGGNDFGRTRFTEAELNEANFTDSVLIGARLDNATVDGAVFSAADCRRTNFDGVDMSVADFTSAKFDPPLPTGGPSGGAPTTP